MTSLPESLIEQVPDWEIRKLWENFELLEPNKNIYRKVKNGVMAKFDIRKIIEEQYEIFPTINTIRILGVGEMDLIEYWDEIDEREKIMREFIYDNYNKDITKGRIDD